MLLVYHVSIHLNFISNIHIKYIYVFVCFVYSFSFTSSVKPTSLNQETNVFWGLQSGFCLQQENSCVSLICAISFIWSTSLIADSKLSQFVIVEEFIVQLEINNIGKHNLMQKETINYIYLDFLFKYLKAL